MMLLVSAWSAWSFLGAVNDGSPIHLDGQRLLFVVFHPAARPKNRTFQQMRADWDRIAKYLKN
jgi:hypothetical protein